MKPTRTLSPRAVRVATTASVVACILASGPADADPWIPAAGHGTFKPMLRYYTADRSFSETSFGTSTHSASVKDLWQLRLTGNHGIGSQLAVEYDLRAAQISVAHTHATYRATGWQDQLIGLNYGLRQTRTFADSVSVDLVFPTGSATDNPALSTGQTAVEPDYQVGIARRGWNATLRVGPRIFLDGQAVQLRADATLGVRITPRLTLGGRMFLVRTVHRSGTVPAEDEGELYDLFRPGLKLEYHPQGQFRNWRPFVGYDDYLAGKGMHAGHRIFIGVSLRY